jgi:hypothetical protein
VAAEAIGVEGQLAVGTGLQFAAGLAGVAEFLAVVEVEGFEEVLGVVGLAGLGDVAFDGEVENGDEEVEVGEGGALAGVVVPEVLVLLVDAPDLSCIDDGLLWIFRVFTSAQSPSLATLMLISTTQIFSLNTRSSLVSPS